MINVDDFCNILEKNGIAKNTIKSPSDNINCTVQDLMCVWDTAVKHVSKNIINNLPARIADKLSITDGGDLISAINAAGNIDDNVEPRACREDIICKPDCNCHEDNIGAPDKY